jgi:biopolymer transport protein ExbB
MTRWILRGLLALGVVTATTGLVQAIELSQANTVDELLEQVRSANQAESEANRRRLETFRRERAQQQRLLAEAQATLAAEENRADQLKAAFDENEKAIPELTQKLKDREGTLGEVFGVVRQVAGDTRAQLQSSLISVQYPGREEFLDKVSESRTNPKMEDLERLWFMLQQQMTEQGKVVRFPATVVSVEGGEQQTSVVRVGPFNAVADGKYLQFVPETGKLGILARQPESRHTATIDALTSATDVVGFAIDPSRGSILNKLIEAPSLEERIEQGGAVGYVILVLGILGVALAVYRLAYLAFVGRKIKAQLGQSEPSSGNPLGRILSVYDQNRRSDTETLELKLEEAILKETSPLESGEAMIKVLSVVAPLLGLLGTVTGMIQTFQAITLFGTGDPKMMASGISTALVTTVLGLCAAIPLTLLHSVVSSYSSSLVQILEEQSAGLVAEHAEEMTPGPELRRVAVG